MTSRKRNSGWILLETMVAMAVLGIGMVAMNRALGEALATRAQARDYTQARFFLEQVMSELELQPLFQPDSFEEGDFGKDHPRFSWRWDVAAAELPKPDLPRELPLVYEDGAETPAPVLGKLTVTVHWTRRERKYEESLETLVRADRLLIDEDDPFADEETT
ncbi:MAG: type II secretion system protein [bacterium]|nr:type II secretion system protein [bacterium]